MFFALHLLAQGADGGATPPGAGGDGLSKMLMPLLLMLAVGYFLLIRPMQKQEKQRQSLVVSLKKNDKIVNSGGIIGVIDSIKEKEDEIVLRGGLRITKSSVVRVVTSEESKDQKEGGA